MSSIQRTVAGQPSIANLPCEITRDDQRTAEKPWRERYHRYQGLCGRGNLTELRYDKRLAATDQRDETADLEFQVGKLGSETFHSATDGNAGILITLR
jgi:hypothetical protein